MDLKRSKNMRCPWCTGPHAKRNLKEFNRSRVINHLVAVEDNLGNIHIHGPIEEAYIMKKFIDKILVEVDKRNINIETKRIEKKNG